MSHPVTDKQQLMSGPFEVSNYPDLISDTTVAFAFCKAVPEIVDELQDTAKLHIKYGSLAIENAMHLNPDLLVDEPDVEIGGSGTFTLMVVDPDVPTPHKPKLRSWLLWLAINIPPHDVKRGEVVVPYEAPAPTGGKRDAHRVLYLLFKQKGRVQSRPPADRRGFQVKAWAQDHNLEKNPATGLFFWTSADEE